MECIRFSPEEIERWSALIGHSPETSELGARLNPGVWEALYAAFHFALEEDFEEMTDALHEDGPALERMKHDPVLLGLIKRLYEHGVACGDAGSCCNLANFYHDTSNGGSLEDYATAIELYELGKERGDGQSAINLGYIFYYGRGVERDYHRAYECFAFGAMMCDNPEGYWKLGDLYASGRGVRKSDYAAWTMYLRAHACASGSPLAARAAHHLADYLLRGIEGHVEPDPEAALRLYIEAETGYYTLIDDGLTYYGRQLEQAIDGQVAARAALQELHRRIREGVAE